MIKAVGYPLRGKIEKYKVDWILNEKEWNNRIQRVSKLTFFRLGPMEKQKRVRGMDTQKSIVKST